MSESKEHQPFEHTRAGVGIGITVVTWSLADIWVSIIQVGIITVLWQAVLACVLLGIGLFATRRNLSIHDFRALLPLGLSRTIGMSALYLSIQTGKVGVVMTIVACSTIVTAGLFAPLIGEKFDIRIIALLIVSFIGIVFASRGDPRTIEWQFTSSEVYAFICMMCFAYSTVLVRRTSLKVEPIRNVFYMYSWMIIFSLPIIALFDLFNIEEVYYSLDQREWLFMIAITIASVIGHVVLTWSQKRTTVTMASMLAPAAAACTAFLAVIIKGDTLSRYQWAGIVVITVAVTVASQIEAKKTALVV